IEPVSPECPHPAVGGPERLRALRLRQRADPLLPPGGCSLPIIGGHRRGGPAAGGQACRQACSRSRSAKTPPAKAGSWRTGSSASVAIGVARQGALDPVPGRAGGLAGILPLQSRVAAVAGLVLIAQVGLDIIEVAPVITGTRLVAGAVRRAVVLVGVVRLHVGLVAVIPFPVLVLGGRVDAFGHALAGQAARDGTDRRPHHRAYRTGRRADRRAGDTAAGGTDARADRVGARGAGDRIAVHVVLVVVVRHVVSPVDERVERPPTPFSGNGRLKCRLHAGCRGVRGAWSPRARRPPARGALRAASRGSD